MNYIQHLNGFYRKANDDERLSPYHLSLYSGIFQLWNASYFEDSFPVNRQELMQLSKIGSRSTYYRCLHQLHEWGYIDYSPSPNGSVPSTISCITFDTAGTTASTRFRTAADTTIDAAAGTTFCTAAVPEMNPFIKLNKTFKNTLSKNNTKKFFDGTGNLSESGKGKTSRSAKIVSIKNSTTKTLKRYDEPL